MIVFFSAGISAQSIATQVKEIDALVRTIDAQVKRPKAAKLIFADVSDINSETPAKWEQFISEKALERHRDKTEAYTIAYVWLSGGKIVSTNFTHSTPSGDWVRYVYSYFRLDGSLARVETDFRTFNGDFRVIRRRYFDTAGKEVKNSVKFLDLQTRQPKKAPNGVMGDDPKAIDYYMTTAKIPFAHLVGKK